MPTFSEKLATVNMKELKLAITALNKAEGNETTIKLVPANKKNMILDLTTVVEDMNAAELEVPEKAVDFFNSFWEGTTDDPLEGEIPKEETTEKKPGASKKKEVNIVVKKKKAEPTAKKEPSTPKAKLRAEFLQKILKKGADKSSIIEQLVSFGDSANEARYQTGIALCLLAAFGVVVEKNGKYKIA